jgi:hypothetical protein
MTDFVDRADHGQVERIIGDIFDEHAVDFQKIDRQIPEAGKRRQPAAGDVDPAAVPNC